MKRTPLIVIAFAFALTCGAWRAHALAGGDSSALVASVPTHASRFPPVPSPTTLRKFDEYGNIHWSDEKLRLDNVAVELRGEPTLRVYIICYGGRRGRAGEARRKCARAAGYLSKARGIETARIFTLDGGFREDLTVELWPFPVGTVTPTGSPTVDPSEVTIIKDSPKRKRAARRKSAR